MEAFLQALLPRLLPERCSFELHPFQGKGDLLRKLPARLRAYRHWLPADWRIVVLIDRDDADCNVLKQQLERIADEAGLRTRTAANGGPWQVVNRIAIEELEAWYFGDWSAVRAAYPAVPADVPRQAAYRDPDAIKGGTWEAFERILQRGGYFKTGLRKIEAARAIGSHIDPARNRSASFRRFAETLRETGA